MSFTILGDILTPHLLHRKACLTIDSGKIVDIASQPPARGVDLDRPGFLVAPGFIDVHVHGAGGADFMNGTEDAVRTILGSHARHGTTSLLATTITASREDVDRTLKAVNTVDERPQQGEAKLLGVHLEGPYICPGKRGAQPAAPIRPADVNELDHWIALSGDKIRKITLAPEMPGAVEFIKEAKARGIISSIGHTDATGEQTQAAIDAGASHATHLFNAMRGLHHREPGALGALLASDSVIAELICDGFHLHPTIVKIAVSHKSPERVLLITDAMAAADMPDGDYELGGQKVISSGGVAAFADGTLAGSTLTMEKAFSNVRSFAGVDVLQASSMASGAPARECGAGDRKGALAVGMDADIAILNPETGEVDATFVEGIAAYRR